MYFLDKLFGSPRPERYARLFMAALKNAGDARECEFDPPQFRLVFRQQGKQAGVTHLTNLFAEYKQVPRSERPRCLKHQVRAVLSYQRQLPDEFEHARPDLRPRLWLRTTLEKMELRSRLDGDRGPDLPLQPVGEHLYATLVFDFPESVHSISRENLDDWGVSYYQAMEVALRNLEETAFTLMAMGESLYSAVVGDSYDAARLLLAERIQELPVAGTHVAMIPNRSALLITGSEDEDGLRLMLELAKQGLEEPRPMLPTPLMLRDGQWEDWLPAVGHPLHEPFNRLQVEFLHSEYHEQKELLDALSEKQEQAHFVASYSAIQFEDQSLRSYAVWSRGVPTLLPRTHQVAFFDEKRGVLGRIDWQRVEQVVGDRLLPTDHYPPRYFVDGFPTDDELQALTAE